jgi:hypothetical protein
LQFNQTQKFVIPTEHSAFVNKHALIHHTLRSAVSQG